MNFDRDAVAPRLSGTPLVLLLDVDGTLAPIAPQPADASVPPSTHDALHTLARTNGVIVGLVSGRSAEEVRRLVPISPTWIIGNHGAEVVSPDGRETVEPRVSAYEAVVAAARAELEASGVAVENKRWTLTVHYRNADPEIVPALREKVSRVAITHGLATLGGKKILELRPPVAVNKGTAVLALGERVGAFEHTASVMYAGDDSTDEDAFLALRSRAPRAVTIHVAGEGSPDTFAEYIVSDPREMGSVLAWLVELRR
ncbi:MAG TPA: trehalose-phosphatase [Gemmatimonadaceae bacterium]|nr:trehalose-phosphatase [Gemmatimonadaceae bacterium]